MQEWKLTIKDDMLRRRWIAHNIQPAYITEHENYTTRLKDQAGRSKR